jgi:hypothetical protein
MMGRPRLYADAESFTAKVEDYFAYCTDSQKSPTLAGLSYYLGFADKQSFSQYEEYGDEFSLTVKRARLRMEADRHERVISKDTFTPGLIFDLKNNHGWRDKTEQELTGADGGPIQSLTRIELVGVEPDDNR